jgi:hypothetical protein
MPRTSGALSISPATVAMPTQIGFNIGYLAKLKAARAQ